MDKFLSCDWGTSAFRLRLITTADLTTLAEITAPQGIGVTYTLLKEKGRGEEERLAFYLSFMAQYIKAIEQKVSFSLQGTPVIISGMASSSVGMVELPYKELPFFVDGTDLPVYTITTSDQLKHDLHIISGVRTTNDVMRGEETQLVGCLHTATNDGLYIFPGTHSKHIVVADGIATDFKTYMTGEFFQLLSRHSILATAVEEGEMFNTVKDKESFTRGVADAVGSNLLHTCFFVRTNALFNKWSRKENYYYLSGLLIGTELNDVRHNGWHSITVVGNTTLGFLYKEALQLPGILDAACSLNIRSADEAVVSGQLKVYKQQKAVEYTGAHG